MHGEETMGNVVRFGGEAPDEDLRLRPPVYLPLARCDSWAVGEMEAPPRWPPRVPALPADELYSSLGAKLDVPERRSHSLWAAVRRTARRILGQVRPHVFDVDSYVCGSFATGTQLPSEVLDVDVVVRFHEPRSTWQEDADAALDEVRSWLSHGIAVDQPATWPLSVPVGEDLRLRLWLAWPEGDQGATLMGPDPVAAGQVLRFDPGRHRDRLIARQESLGGDTPFTELVRVVKLLNRRWGGRPGEEPLSSYSIDVLALTLCRRPFTLPEGVADFLRDAAQLVETSEGSAAAGLAWDREKRERAIAFFREGAAEAEAALMAGTAAEARAALDGLFGADSSYAAVSRLAS